MASRQQLLLDLFNNAKTGLLKLSQGEGYKLLIKQLLVQAFYQLMDPQVTVTCRACDVQLVVMKGF